MATIKEVAEYAGVSTGTVSNYLSGSHPVSLKKQKAIIDAMIALKYEGNASARMLRSKRSTTVGLVVPNISDPYYSRILEGVESYVKSNSFLLYVAMTENDPSIETKVITEMLNNQVSGLIIVTCQPDYTEFFKERLLKNKIPVVFLDRKVTGLAATFLGCSNKKDVFTLVRHRLQQGDRRIAFFSSSLSFSDQADAMEGYREALEQHGIPFDEDLVCTCANDKETAFAEMLQMYPRHLPDGVIATSELIARGIQEALRAFDIANSGQISISALGVDTWDRASEKSGCTLKPRRAMAIGSEAAELLFKQINDPSIAEITSQLYAGGTSLHTQFSSVQYLPGQETIRLNLVPMAPSKALLQMIPAYEKATGVKVQVQLINHAEYFDVLSRSLQDQTAADVVLVDMPWLPIFASNGVLADFTTYIEQRGIDTSIYVGNCIENLCQYKGVIYGLPLMYSPQTLFYRQDLFNDRRLRNAYEQKNGRKLRPPRTWSEFSTIAEFFTRRNNPSSPTKYGVSMPCKYAECLSAEIRMRMSSFGGSIVDKDGRVVFESQENLNAFSQLIQTLSSCPHNYRSKERNDIVQDFIRGNAAMIINFHPILNEAVRANVRNYLGVAPVPGAQSILGGWCMCVPSCSEKKEAAMQFVEWASSMKISSQLMVLNSQSVVANVLDNDELRHRNRWFRSWRDSYQTATPLKPLVLRNDQIVPIGDMDWILFQVVRKVTDENVSLADAIHWGHNEFVSLLNAYKVPDNDRRKTL